MSTQSKRLKTADHSLSAPVEDPLEGKGSYVTSDELENYNLHDDGLMVVDTNLVEAKTFPWEFK